MTELDKSSKHIVVDISTGFIYALQLDASGACMAVQPLMMKVQSLKGQDIRSYGPLAGLDAVTAAKLAESMPLPFGKTVFAVELDPEGKAKGTLFTIEFPSRKALIETGAMPLVGRREMPQDLVAAGFAARPVKKGDQVANADQLQEALRGIDKMIGLKSAKHEIRQNIALSRFNKAKEDMGILTKPISRHMVFSGNPGTGKTTFAREVAKVYHALGLIGRPHVHETTRDDLVGGYIGQTALKTKAEIDKAVGIKRDEKTGEISNPDEPKGGVLFIDEAYALSRDATPGSKDFGVEAIDTLVAAMENMREDLVVIVAGYTEPMKRFINANPGLKSRFLTYIEFEDYSVEELEAIMDVMLKDRGYSMTVDARAKAMQMLQQERDTSGKSFGNGRTVRNLVEKAEKELALRLEADGTLARTGDDSQDADTLRKVLTEITLEDISRVNLKGFEKNAGLGMVFEGAVRRNATNDNPLAPGLIEPPAEKKPREQAAKSSARHRL